MRLSGFRRSLNGYAFLRQRGIGLPDVVYHGAAFSATLGAAYAVTPTLTDEIKLSAVGTVLTPSIDGTPLATRTDGTYTERVPGVPWL